jgi:hypothetical protein
MANFEPNESEPNNPEIINAEIVESEIHEAEFVDHQKQFPPNHASPVPEKRSSVLVVLAVVGGFLLLLLGLIGGAIWLMMNMDKGSNREEAVATTDVPTRDPMSSLALGPAKWRTVAEAFREPGSDVSAKTRLAVKSSLDEIIKASETDDGDVMRKFIHQDGFLDQMVRSKWCTLNIFDRANIKRSFDMATDGPTGFYKFKISSILRIDEDEAIVYLYLWGNDDAVREYCFWMRESGNKWKLTDWESLRVGISEAAIYALLVEKQETAQIQNYYKATELTSNAFAMLYEGEEKEAIEKFQESFQITMHQRLQGSSQMSNGFGLAQAYDWEKSTTAFEQIKDKEVTPGAYYGLSLVHYRQENYEESIANVDKYLNQVGVSPSAMRIKANALFELEKRDEAIDVLKELISLVPEDDTALESLVSWLPNSRTDELIDILGDNDASVETALSLARKTYLFEGDAMINTLAKIVESNGGGKAKSFELKALAAQNKYEYPQAAEHFLSAMNAESDPESIESIQDQYLSLMNAMERDVEGLQGSKLKGKAFEFLTDEYNEFETQPEIKLALVNEGRKQNIKSNLLDYVEANVLIEQNKLEEARSLLQSGLKKAQELEKSTGETLDDGASGTATSYAYLLRSVLMDLDDSKQALLVGGNRISSFNQVAGRLRQRKKYEELESVVADFRSWDDTNPKKPASNSDSAESAVSVEYMEDPKHLIRFYDAVVLLHKGDKTALATLFEFLVDQKTVALQYETRATIADWVTQNSDWASAVKSLPKSLTDSEQGREALSNLFANIFAEQLADESYTDIEDLVEIHQSMNLEKELPAQWKMEVAKKQENDKSFIQIAESLSEQDWDAMSYYSRASFESHWIDALLRQGKNSDATKTAERIGENKEDSDKMDEFVCYVSEKNIEACRKILVEHDVQSYFFYSQLSQRDGSKAYFSATEFKELRDEFPVVLNYVIGGPEQMYLMYMVKPDLDEIESKLKTLIPNNDSARSINLDSEGRQQRIFNLPDSQVFLTLANAQMESYTESSSGKAPKHEYVLVITQFTPQGNELFSIEQVLETIVDESCVASYDSEQEVLLESPLDWLKNRQPNEAYNRASPQSESFYLSSEDEGGLLYWEKRRKELSDKAELKKRLADGDKNLEALVEFSAGSVKEKHWFPIERYTTDEDQTDELIVRRNAEVVIFPSLQQGELHKLPSFATIEWRESK